MVEQAFALLEEGDPAKLWRNRLLDRSDGPAGKAVASRRMNPISHATKTRPSMSLKQELAEYCAGWFKRVPVERQAIMEQHIAQLRSPQLSH